MLLVVALSVFIGMIGILIGAVVVAIAFPIAGIVLIGFAVYNLFLFPSVGITLGGVGCLLLSVGILIFLLAIWLCKTLLPLSIRGIVSLIRYPFRKAGVLK